MLQLHFGTCQKIDVEQRVHWQKFITLSQQKVAHYLRKSHLLGTKLHMAEKHVLLVVKLALSPRMQHLGNERHCYLVTH